MRKEENAMEQNTKPELEQIKPDWSIDELYRNAWQIVKKNKILWLFGMAVGAGSFSSNYSNSFNQKDLDSLFRLFDKLPKESSEASKVLGASTSTLSETIGNLFAGIPPAYYVLLGLEILILIIIGMTTSIIYSSWAHAGLLEGIQTAILKGKLTIRDLSEKAFGSIKAVMYVSYVPILLLVFGTFILFAFLGILTATIPDTSKTFLVFLVPVLIISLLVAISVITLLTIWAVRIVVIDKKPGKLALKMGYKIAKKKFWASVLLGIVNTIAVGLLYIIILIPIIGLIAGGAFAISKDTYLGTVIIVVGFILIMLFVLFASILSGIIGAFKAAVWSLAYNAIKGKYEN